jgi:hypothetical protein
LPEANRWREEIDRAIEGIEALRKRTGKITLNGLQIPMSFVRDASVAAGWAFEDEARPTAPLVLQRIRTGEARVPGQ